VQAGWCASASPLAGQDADRTRTIMKTGIFDGG
jgi:hypothetical protein